MKLYHTHTSLSHCLWRPQETSHHTVTLIGKTWLNPFLFPVYQKLDKLICTASLPAHSKRDLGWGRIPCQAPICLPASTAIISHIISVTITSKSSSPWWGPHCYPVHKHSKDQCPCCNGAWLLSLKQTDRETQLFPLILMVAPCWQTQNPGNWGQIL